MVSTSVCHTEYAGSIPATCSKARMCSKYEAATSWRYYKSLTNLDVRAAEDLTLDLKCGADGMAARYLSQCSRSPLSFKRGGNMVGVA